MAVLLLSLSLRCAFPAVILPAASLISPDHQCRWSHADLGRLAVLKGCQRVNQHLRDAAFERRAQLQAGTCQRKRDMTPN